MNNNTQSGDGNAPSSALRNALKQATADAHAAVERLPLMVEVASGTISDARYRDYLGRSLALQQAVASACTRLDRRTAFWSGERLMWLRADAQAAATVALGHLPRARAVLAQRMPTSPAAAWGALYVQEGAALGAQLLLKANRGHVVVEAACQHLRGRGPATLSRWRDFLTALAAQTIDDAGAVAGALAVFAAYQAVFTERADKRVLPAVVNGSLQPWRADSP